MKTLEAEKAAEQFAKVLDEVHSRRETFTIVKNGVAYAQLVPAVQSSSNSHEFAEDLAQNRLAAQAQRFAKAAQF